MGVGVLETSDKALVKMSFNPRISHPAKISRLSHLGVRDGEFVGVGGKNFVGEREVVGIVDGDDSGVRLRIVRVKDETRREDENRKATFQKIRATGATETHFHSVSFLVIFCFCFSFFFFFQFLCAFGLSCLFFIVLVSSQGCFLSRNYGGNSFQGSMSCALRRNTF